MAYRKLKARKIFTGNQLLDDRVLVVAGNGSVIDLIPAGEAGYEVEVWEGWLCPGFVNAHCHIELSHMKGKVPPGTGMTDFLLKVLLERQASPEEKQVAMQEALGLMLHNGIVAVGDICNTTDSLQPKLSQAGIKYQNFVELTGFVPASASSRLDQALQVGQQFRQHFPTEQVHITPHAAYSVSEKLFQLLAAQSPAIVSIHNQESEAEENFIKNKTGDLLRLYKAIGVSIDFFEATQKNSLQYMLPQLPASAQWLLVHNCHTQQDDISFLQQTLADHIQACFLCICPNANLYIGNPLPDLPLLLSSGIPLCLGTDSLTNNDQLSILSELQTLRKHFPQIPLEQTMQWATLNGARALQMEAQLGSFEKGKQPGVLLLQDIGEDESLLDCQITRLL
jgi:cytosine/adenosine deaminase-related metal-dependent hydrolase